MPIHHRLAIRRDLPSDFHPAGITSGEEAGKKYAGKDQCEAVVPAGYNNPNRVLGGQTGFTRPVGIRLPRSPIRLVANDAALTAMSAEQQRVRAVEFEAEMIGSGPAGCRYAPVHGRKTSAR